MQVDAGKTKTRSQSKKSESNNGEHKAEKSCSSEKSQGTEKVEKVVKETGSSQKKIDSMLVKQQKEQEPSISVLIQTINSFEEKMNTSIKNLVSKDYIDKSFQNVASEKFLEEKMASLKDDISRGIKQELDKVYDQLRSIKEKLLQSEKDIKDLRNEAGAMQVEMETMKEEINKVKEQNKQLKEQLRNNDFVLKKQQIILNDQEQYSRRNNVRIYGIADDNKDESASKSAEKVVALIKEHLEVEISVDDIDIAHRIGKFQTDGNRVVICKFLRRTTKQSVLAVRKKLKGKSIIIREDLTTRNAKLLERVSGLDGVKNVWSDEGRVIALLADERKVRINLDTDLSKLLH